MPFELQYLPPICTRIGALPITGGPLIARIELIAELEDVLKGYEIFSLFDSALYNSAFCSCIEGWKAEMELTYPGVIH